MQYSSKTLWTSLFALPTILLIAWFMLTQNGAGLPAKVLEQMATSASNFEKSLTPALEEKSPEATTEQQSGPLPQTSTYYRWTDDQGHTGYSDDLPENVSSFKAIVLNRLP